MAKLSRSQQVRIAKVQKDADARQNQLQKAGVGLWALSAGAAIVNPILGASILASGGATIAKESYQTNRRAKSETNRIKRSGGGFTPTLKAAGDAVRADKAGRPPLKINRDKELAFTQAVGGRGNRPVRQEVAIKGASQTRSSTKTTEPIKSSGGRNLMSAAGAAYHGAKADKASGRAKSNAGFALLWGGAAAAGMPGAGYMAGAYAGAAVGRHLESRSHGRSAEGHQRDMRIDQFRQKYGNRGEVRQESRVKGGPEAGGGRLNAAQREQFNRENNAYRKNNQASPGHSQMGQGDGTYQSKGKGVYEGGMGFANPVVQKAAQAAKGREFIPGRPKGKK